MPVLPPASASALRETFSASQFLEAFDRAIAQIDSNDVEATESLRPADRGILVYLLERRERGAPRPQAIEIAVATHRRTAQVRRALVRLHKSGLFPFAGAL